MNVEKFYILLGTLYLKYKEPKVSTPKESVKEQAPEEWLKTEVMPDPISFVGTDLKLHLNPKFEKEEKKKEVPMPLPLILPHLNVANLPPEVPKAPPPPSPSKLIVKTYVVTK